MTGAPVERCPFCGAPAPIIWVHGQGQCLFCGMNREPCCDGVPEEPLAAGLPTLITPRLILFPFQAEAQGHPQGYGFWKIAVASERDRIVGEVGMTPRAASGEIELSFRIDLVARGQGFAGEAARAVIADGVRRLGIGELVALVDPDHRGPARVLHRLGFLADGRRAVGEGRQVVLWRWRKDP
jgi:RimJ/RimL family protein N-acetyltransferase